MNDDSIEIFEKKNHKCLTVLKMKMKNVNNRS